MTQEKIKSSKNQGKDKYILFAFLGFFGIVFLVNAIFITTALKTHRGEIIEHAYEKGIRYNDTLAEAKNQPSLKDRVSFEKNILRWDLGDTAINNAEVKARIIRPIQDGHDFDIVLDNKGNGIYEAILTLPFNGLWEARLSSTWDNKTYKTTHQIIQK